MNPRVLMTAAMTGLLCFTTVFAQDGANFSGTWVKDAPTIDSPALPAAVEASPVRLVIEQSPTSVHVTRQRLNGQSDRATYSFKTAQSHLPKPANAKPADPNDGGIAPGPAGNGVAEAQAEWKDGGLLLLTTLIVNGKPVTTSERLTVSPETRKLVVETALMVHHGYESVGGAAATPAGSTSRDVYTRAND